MLDALDRYLRQADLSLADVFGHSAELQTTATLDDRIREAYAKLRPRPGGWVSLTHLRVELADVPRAEVDAALHTLYRTPGASLIPEENKKVLTDADRPPPSSSAIKTST